MPTLSAGRRAKSNEKCNAIHGSDMNLNFALTDNKCASMNKYVLRFKMS